MRAEKLLLRQTYVNWFLMLVMMLLMAAAWALKGFPFPLLAVCIVGFGVFWSLFGILLSLITFYDAWKKHSLKLWVFSTVMNIMSFYSFMTLASMY